MTDDYEREYEYDTDRYDKPVYDTSHIGIMFTVVALLLAVALGFAAFDKYTRPPMLNYHLLPPVDLQMAQFQINAITPFQPGWKYSCIYVDSYQKMVYPAFEDGCFDNYIKYRKQKRGETTNESWEFKGNYYSSNHPSSYAISTGRKDSRN